MKLVANSTRVFKTFKSDFKALVSSLDKLSDNDRLKDRTLDSISQLCCGQQTI